MYVIQIQPASFMVLFIVYLKLKYRFFPPAEHCVLSSLSPGFLCVCVGYKFTFITVFWYNIITSSVYLCVLEKTYTVYVCAVWVRYHWLLSLCVFVCACERKEGSLASWSQAAETLYWNVNWYDWSASQITHKAAFNKPKIRMSHHLIPLRGRGCVCTRRRGEGCLLESLLFLSCSLPRIFLPHNK